MSKAKPAQPLGRRSVPEKAPAYVRGRDVRAKLLHLLELGGMPGRQIFIDSFQFWTAGRVPRGREGCGSALGGSGEQGNGGFPCAILPATGAQPVSRGAKILFQRPSAAFKTNQIGKSLAGGLVMVLQFCNEKREAASAEKME